MNLNVAFEHLKGMANGPFSLERYAIVHSLLCGFHKANTNIDGSMKHAYANEKICCVEHDFQALCGLTEETDVEYLEKIKDVLQSDLSKLNQIIEPEGLELRTP